MPNRNFAGALNFSINEGNSCFCNRQDGLATLRTMLCEALRIAEAASLRSTS